VPSQGSNTFSSFLMYLNTQDVGVVVTDVAIAAAGGDTGGDTDPEPSTAVALTEAFGGATIGDGSLYTYPAGAEGWAGFANMNEAIYPITLAEDSVITFKGSVPTGGAVDVRFRFEFKPHPDTDPAYDTTVVTVSGADSATYSIAVPSQGSNTFSSFLMYLNTQDVGVVVTDVAIAAAGGDTGGGADPAAGITVAESSEFYDKDNATWVKVIDLAFAGDGVSSQGSQTLSINVTELPEGGANYRVYKTTATGGNYFSNAKPFALGANDITIAGVAFDRTVRIQLSSADVRFDSLVLNGNTIYPEPVE